MWRVALISVAAGTYIAWLGRKKKDKMPLQLVLSGPPGSGKTTVCRQLRISFGARHICIGDVLRDHVKRKTLLGTEARGYVEAGKAVPDDVILKMLMGEVVRAKGGWLLDGMPRTRAQAEAMSAMSFDPKAFIILDVPDASLGERITKRRMDPATGEIYHLDFRLPTNPAVERRLTRRKEDTEEALKERLETYHALHSGIKEFYEEKGVLVELNGFEGGVKGVYHNLLRTFELPDMAAWQAVKPFVTGSVAGCLATWCLQPLDMVKVRIQLGAAKGDSTNPLRIAWELAMEEGIGGIYAGLSASLTRQVVYTCVRLGLYDYLAGESSSRPFWKKAICALTAGVLAAVAGNPADVALIRMQADMTLPAAERRGYRGFGHALLSIFMSEGVMGLLRGAIPTALRSTALMLGMMGTNQRAKGLLEKMGAGKVAVVFGTASIAGFCASFLSLPFDYVKTQVQQMRPDPTTGELAFEGPLDCAVRQMSSGGITCLWTSLATYFLRTASHAGLTLFVQDQIKRLWPLMGL